MCPRFNPLGLENLCANLNVSNQHCENGYTEKRFSAEQITFASCALAVSGHNDDARRCPLLGAKRTSVASSPMSAFDPKRTLLPSDIPLTLKVICGGL